MDIPRASDHGSNVLPRVLGPVEAFSVVVGCVIGSGIFLVPASVARNAPFIGEIVLVWIVAGLFSAAGALTLAELAAMMPHAGGPYVYLRAAYGRIPAFLFGWTEFTVARTGSMATLAAAFARYFVQLVPPPPFIHGQIWQAAAAITAIAVVITVNVLGTRHGGALQVFGTVLKVGGVVALILLPLLLWRGSLANLNPVWPTTLGGSMFTGMMAAMVHVLWAYDGWVNVTPMAEEVRNPGRNVPRALILGMVVLVVVYLAMTLAYHLVLPLDEVIAANKGERGIENAVAAVYCRNLLGHAGVLGISILVMCSTFISLNGNALTGPRAYFAMSRDGLLPRSLGRVHDRFQTPANAIMAQGVWASMLVVLGTALIVVPPPNTLGTSQPFFSPILTAWTKLNQTPLYDLLLSYVIFGTIIFNLLAITSVFVLRVKAPDLPRPYRTWGYPFTPLLYVVAALVLLGNMLFDEQTLVPSIVGLGLILAGIPASAVLRRRTPGD